MPLTERSRHKLYETFTALIDDETAVQEMLSYFPARDVEEPVTKDFLRAELQTEIGALRAELHSVLAKDVLLVPLTAITEVPGGHRVTRVDGTVVPITLGQTSPTHAEVQSGLAEGDQVRLVEPASPDDAPGASPTPARP